ncbi:MAG: Hint domain-containing protein [Alphaproteobacteria bacterium]|nr:Hint domain-containing protein [Alphaproteobacteria bacterium]MBU1277823.1 Hint domain-containing protein [Alphaproteobacteria bacterium]MBU1830252.1 Hint domain-containing protein [Alphaproteobacteria bacterium]MBU2079790.1 Hint domain-containing protein [Alphaproteobacteria bacterium]MBU2162564.1 Hint domain-containing protein [Alphaproteobacteria bacterium]
MAVYDLNFYTITPTSFISNTTGSTFTYAGPSVAAGSALINDTGTGVNQTALTDDNAGESGTTGTVTVGANTSTGSNIDAEAVWTVKDMTTGEVFQIASLDVENGAAAGTYTLSESPLIPGHTYQVVAYDSLPDATDSTPDQVFSYADYTDGIIEGTAGDDTIDSTTTQDPQGEMVDQGIAVESTFSWESLGSDGGSIAGGLSTDINGVQVDVSYTDLGPGQSATISNETLYTENGDFDRDSSVLLLGDNSSGGGSDTSSLTFDFSSATGTMADEVQNVSFRISDLDVYSFTDTITITAVDADGNPVAVTITSEGAVSVSGNTATGTADATGITAGNANGAILVDITGPVSSFTITYGNADTGYQGVNISDVTFEAIYADYDDVIDAGAGNDTIDAGLGDDTVYAGTGNDAVVAGAGNDTVYGGTGDDILDGGDGTDVLFGEDGNDTLIGGAGDDTMSGGTGNDTFIGGAGSDSMSGGSGQDTVDYSASSAGVSVNLANGTFSGGDATGDSGSGIDGIIGSDFDDTLIGFDGQSTDGVDSYTNVFYGGAGDDYLDGAGGDDELYGGTGNDTIIGGAGADLIDGGDGDDTIYAGGGDTITGGEGNDTIIIDPSQLDGNAINIVGSETGDSDTGDVLDLSLLGSNFVHGSIVYDEADPESGSLTLVDGTTITFSNIETVICFGKGTRVATPYGPRRVEDLKRGDLVLTLDHGPQPLRWIGAREVPAVGRFAPIEIAKGALGNSDTLIVSPQHRMLLKGWQAEMHFGASEVFAAAKHLVNDSTIRPRVGGLVTYYHLMFDAHEVIFAEDAPSESFHVSDYSLTGVADAARDELFGLFPELRALPSGHGDTARKCLKAHEAGLLVA